jgi:hypothetical protein
MPKRLLDSRLIKKFEIPIENFPQQEKSDASSMVSVAAIG